mmetsp:Transcript_16859/g.36814  ORF Transcript_16859/g.36814 Transcript_16859/m.36814 type:complete len:314 (+) Transcript_16859:472-1413(+)
MQNLQQITALNRSNQDNQRHSTSRECQIDSKPNSTNDNDNNNNNNTNKNNDNNTEGAVPAAPMCGELEPAGLSIGDVSMMTAATNLSNFPMGGTSFGTTASYNMLNDTTPGMVDGGLMDAVGTSFGSLSLDRSNLDTLYKTLEIAAGGSEVPPMLLPSESKATGNLLDCSDTESESSREKEKLTHQKSQAWEMMKTQLDNQKSKGNSIDSKVRMPPPVGIIAQQDKDNTQRSSAPASATSSSNQPDLDNFEIAFPPTTTMEANFSTLSAWNAADDGDDGDSAVGKKEGGTAKQDDEDAAAMFAPPLLAKTDSF